MSDRHKKNAEDPKQNNRIFEVEEDILYAAIGEMPDQDAKDVTESDLKEFHKLRFKLLIRALYGEFAATFIYYVCVFGALANGFQNNWNPDLLTLAVAFVAAFEATAVIYTFANVSGAVFNPAITVAFWLTGKLSNRKCACYIAIQLIAVIAAMLVVYICFPTPDQALFDFLSVTPRPGVSLWKIWATEFISTAILTYVAFTIVYEDAAAQIAADQSFRAYTDESQQLTVFAATPQSKSGFAPFVIGFTVASLVLFSGASGAAMSPCRMFGPAVFSGKWDRWYVYYSAEFAGAAAAGVVAHALHYYAADAPAAPSTSADGGKGSGNGSNTNAISSSGNGNSSYRRRHGADTVTKDTKKVEPSRDCFHAVYVDEESNLILTPRTATGDEDDPVAESHSRGSITQRIIGASLSAWARARDLKPLPLGNLAANSGKSSQVGSEAHEVGIRSPLMQSNYNQ